MKEKEEAIDPDDPEVVTVEDGYASDKGNNADKDPKSESSVLKINIRKAGGRFFID